MSTRAKRKNRIRRCILSALLVMYTGQNSLMALPQGGTVTQGSANLSVEGGTLTIQQDSGTAIINYDSFGIGLAETVRFMQPDASASALNRVLGSGRSEIEGALLANGRIYLINPNGILFSSSARVDVGGLVASAMNMTDDDFLAGRMQFAGGSGDVINQGSISAGFAYLVGRNVENHGTINADRVALAAGEYSVLIDEAAGGTIELVIDAVDADAVTPASNAVAEVSMIEDDGVGTDAGGVPAVDSTVQIETADLESVTVTPPSILNEGIINSSGDVGGQVVLAGGNIDQMGTINADGILGDGGSISLQASDTVTLGEASVTTANAGANGQGGEILVIGEQTAVIEAGAQIAARGGSESGDGGFVETSGHETIRIGAMPDVSAPAGHGGTWLIDPTDITITNGANAAIVGSPVADNTLYADDISTFLGTGSLIIETDPVGAEAGNINWLAGADVTWNTANSLSLVAHSNITFNGSIDSTQGDVSFNAQGNIVLNGSISTGTAGLGLTATNGAITQTGGTLAGGALTFASGGVVTLDSVGNDFDSASGTAGGAVTLVDVDGLDLAGVDAGANALSVTVGGALTDSAANTAGALTFDAVGVVALDDAGNDFGSAAGTAGGTITLVDADDLVLAGVDAGTNALSVTVGGALTDTAANTAGALTFDAGGVVTLDAAANDFTSAAGTAGGTITIRDADTLEVTGLNSGGNNAISVTVDAGSLTLSGNVNAGTAGVTLAAAGAITNSGAGLVTAGALTVDAGTGIDLNTDVATLEFTAGDVRITEAGDATVAGQTTANNGLIDISAPGGTLTVGVVGVSTGLVAHGSGSIDLQNALISGVNVTSTSGNITFTGATETDTGAVLISSGGGNINVGGTLDLGSALTVAAGTGNVAFSNTVNGGHALVVNSSGTTTFGGAVGGTTALTSLTTDAAGETAITGGAITTTGDQAYNDDVRLGANTVLSGSNVVFAIGINGDGNDLAINAPVTIVDNQLNGGAATNVGMFTAGQLANVSGDTSFADGYTMAGATTLEESWTVSGTGNITFSDTVDGDYALVVNTTGTTTFGGAVGGTAALTSLTTDAGGTTAINGGAITTGGAQTYNDNVTLGAGTTLSSTHSGNITFGGTLNGAQSLAVSTAGSTTFSNTVGGTTALSNLDVVAADISFAADVAVTQLTTLEATHGSITQSGGTLSSDRLALRAATGIGGPGAAALSINVSQLALVVTNGSAYISEQDGLIIGSVDGLEGAVASANVKIESGVSGAGNLVVGNVVTATAGDVLLDSQQGDLVVGVQVTAATNATLLASGGISQSATGDAQATAGDLYVNATGGSITMAAGATGTAGGNVLYQAADDVTLGGVSGTGVRIEATAGDIIDGGNGHVDVTATTAQLVAGGSVGAAGTNAIDTAVGTLAASAGTGSIYVSETDGLVIGDVGAIDVRRVQMDSTAPVQAGSTLSGAVAGLNVKIENGVSGAGNLVVSNAVTATAGDVLLDARNGDLFIGAAVTAGTNVTLLAAGGITQDANIEATAGDLYVNAAGGSITMADGTTGTAGGNALYLAATNVTLGGVSGTGVRIEATAGDIIDGGDSDVDVTATTAQLVAGGSVGGAGTNAIDTVIGTLAASAGTGSITVSEADGLMIGSVAIDVGRVQMDSDAPVQEGTGLQGVESAQNVMIESGVSGVGNLVVGNMVTATTGDVLLDSRNGDLVVGAAVTAGVNATLLASGGITQDASIEATVGDLFVNAEGGSITMGAGTVSTAGGNIRYDAQDSVALGHLNATGVASRVSVIAQTGDITDANGDTSANITADGARLWAGGSIGAGGGTQSDNNATALDIAVNRIEAYAGTNIYLQSDRAVEVGNVGDIATTYVRIDGTTAGETDTGLVGITAVAGVAKLESAGTITFSENVTAGTDALLLASTGDIILQADLSAGHHASVIAAGGFNQSSNITATTGDVYVHAQGGSITMGAAAVSTAGGNISYSATNSVVLGHLNAASGNVLVQAGNGSITSAGGAVNITAEGVQLLALRGGLGEEGGNGAILLDADRLAANSRDSQYLNQIAAGGNLEVGTVAAFDVNQVRFDSGITPVAVGELDGLTSEASIDLAVDAGSLTINDPVDANQTVNLVASADINQNVDVTAQGNIALEAQNGSIRMAQGTETRSTAGDIRYTAGQDITFASLIAPGGSVYLNAGNAVAGDEIESLGSISIAARTLRMTRLSTQNNASLTITGDLDMEVLNVGRQLDLRADGQARVGTLTVGGAANVNIGRGFTGQSMQLGSGAIRVGGGLDYATIRSGRLDINAGSITFDRLTASTVNARAGGNINMGTVNARTATFTAGRAIVDNNSMLHVNSLTMSARGDIGSSARPINLNVPNINRITSGGNITLVQNSPGLSTLGLISAAGGFDITVPNGGFRNGNGGEVNLQAGSTSRLYVHDTIGTWGGDNPIRIEVGGGDMNINTYNRFADPENPAWLWMVFEGFLPGDRIVYQGGAEIPGLVILNGRVIAGGREILRELYRTQAYAVENQELKSRQGVFGSPLFLTGLTMVSVPMEMDMTAYLIESQFSIETDGF